MTQGTGIVCKEGDPKCRSKTSPQSRKERRSTSMPGDDPGGIIVTILLGIAGAFVGGFIMQSILGFGSGGFIWSIIVATIGAIILLAIYRLIIGRRTT